MNNEQTKLLEQLAAKLGTTVDMVWATMLVQARIDAVVSLLVLALMVIITSRASVQFKTALYEHKTVDSDGTAAVAISLGAVSVMLGTMTLVYTTTVANRIVSGFLNPEYVAITKIAAMLTR